VAEVPLRAHPYLVLAGGATRRILPNRWDLIAAPLIFGVLSLFAVAARQMSAPVATVEQAAVSLDPSTLPIDALRTVLRMLAALAASLVFTFAYGALAAKSRRAGQVLLPILDILQSVPVLGYISFTVVFFMALFPGSVAGAELAAIFAIFTSQAWNMTFSFYQSLITVPRDLDEACRSLRLGGWQRFWRLEVPFAMPGLIWNMMMSMSGGWFFVVASEAITVGDRHIVLPGVGSYVAAAIDAHDLAAVGWAILAMVLVIALYDQLMFRPLVAWADKFRVELTGSQTIPESWFLRLLQRTRLIRQVADPVGRSVRRVAMLRFLPQRREALLAPRYKWRERAIDVVWYLLVGAAALWGAQMVVRFVLAELGWNDVVQAAWLGLLTMIRVMLLIALASLVWVPIGVAIGLRPRLAERLQPLAQFLAAFPANLLFPVAVVVIVRWQLDPGIWLSPLLVLGTQWYILFNVIAGASVFPNDLREAASNLRIRGWLWWRRVILPGIFPYYVTGAITAAGGAWNASIVAEAVSWGDTKLRAPGVGAYIADATAAGDYPRILLGIAVMSLFVILFNRLLWRPLYGFAERRLRMS
jgi:NitT/TauT family transport system permease protein